MKKVEERERVINEEQGIQFYVDILNKQDDPVKFYFEFLHMLDRFEESKKEGEHRN